jgi:hypothetical protein
MAEFRDWLNRKVLNLSFDQKSSEVLTGNIHIVFQQNIFIDNNIGWRDELKAEIKLYQFRFNQQAISEFVIAAKNWLKLPINELGSVYFNGKWSFGFGEDNQLDLDFQPYYSTASKTDWFNLSITIKSEALIWEEEFHTDYSCLALFVEGLPTYA